MGRLFRCAIALCAGGVAFAMALVAALMISIAANRAGGAAHENVAAATSNTRSASAADTGVERATSGVLGVNASGTKSQAPSFRIQRPTIIAFFPPVSDKDLDDDPDTDEALSDFQYYADEVRGPLKKAGIDFEETYTRAFTVHVGDKTNVFRAGKIEVGYYFIAPGKKPRVEYGVMTDDDILSDAHEYFGVPIPDADSSHQARLIEPNGYAGLQVGRAIEVEYMLPFATALRTSG